MWISRNDLALLKQGLHMLGITNHIRLVISFAFCLPHGMPFGQPSPCASRSTRCGRGEGSLGHECPQFLFWTASAARICSYEHERRAVPFLGANIAQINRQTSTTGVGFMDPALHGLIVALRSIRDQADSALKKIE